MPLTALPAPASVPLTVGDGGGVFGVLHPAAAGTATDTAVLLLPPWGWDEIASHRSRRAWAQALADAGHPTLRIDLPGTGDSAGSPRDAELVEHWTAAVGDAAAALRRDTGSERLAVLALGLSGLLALRAIGRGAPVDDLVLWGCPTDGRAFVRRARATSLLEGAAGDERADGSIVAGGFLLSAQALVALARLQPCVRAGARLSRILVLEEDAAGPTRVPDVPGARVTVAPAAGWTELVGHPETTRPPAQVMTGVRDWLAEPASAVPAPAPAPAPREGRPGPLVLHEGGAVVLETPFTVDAPAGRLAGVLCAPHDGRRDGRLCAVFLNAGAVRRVGPNRMWVEAARRWAAGRGVPSLRLDLPGIGEADGPLPDADDLTGSFYAPAVAAQIEAALDALVAQGSGRRFLLAGLCAGGHWAFQRAQDERVCSAVALNPGALVWDPHARGRRELRRLRRLADPGWWAKLAAGGVDLRAERLAAASSALAPRRRGGAAPGGAGGPLQIADRLAAQGTPLVLAFSAGEPLHEDLVRDGLLDRLARCPGVRLADLPGTDHTLRSPAAQCAAHRLLDETLDRALARPDA